MNKVEIRSETDIVRARLAARDLAAEIGFSLINKTRIATAVSELARNVYRHGGGGFMEVYKREENGRVGMQCNFVDEGPGIPDIDQAMGEGFTTAGTLGQGLPGTRRLMDDLRVQSKVGEGTRVETIKWK